MVRKVIEISNEQWELLTTEEWLDDGNGNNAIKKIVDNTYEYSGRHTEHWCMVFQYNDGFFYKINYQVSVKDSMGWGECNYGHTKAVQVFPIEVTTTIFK